MSMLLRSKRVLLDCRIEAADLLIENGRIERVAEYGSLKTGYDFGDNLITPGFIDLHSDAIETEIEPRPGAVFPVGSAIVSLDKKLAIAGITTMYHSIAFNEEALVGQRGNDTAAMLIRTISDLSKANGEKDGDSPLLTIDNFVHARYELTSFTSVPVIKQLIAENRVQMLSVMDHSPGQGQFKTLEKWKEYHIPVYELSDTEVTDVISRQKAKRARCHDYIKELTQLAGESGILIASHDDDTKEKIDYMKGFGVDIAEFPLNVETAIYAGSRGMATGMGAPNVVRGRSQSGNISARELLGIGCCDYLCSDYHPGSILQAVYALHREMNFDLARSFSFVTSVPAKSAKLTDRGVIQAGHLADLTVIDDSRIPQVVMTIKNGSPIYSGVMKTPALLSALT